MIVEYKHKNAGYSSRSELTKKAFTFSIKPADLSTVVSKLANVLSSPNKSTEAIRANPRAFSLTFASTRRK